MLVLGDEAQMKQYELFEKASPKDSIRDWEILHIILSMLLGETPIISVSPHNNPKGKNDYASID